MTIRLSSLTLAFVIGLMLLFYLGNLLGPLNPMEIAVDGGAVFAIFFILAAFLVAAPLQHANSRKFIFALLVYAGTLLISTLISGNPRLGKVESFAVDLLLDTKAFIFALALLLLVPNEELKRGIRIICVVLLAMGLLNLLFILRDQFDTTSIFGQPLMQRAGLSIPSGFLGHKTKSAQVQLLATIAGLALIRGGWLQSRTLLTVITGVMALTVALHLSVKEIGSLAIVLIVFFALKPGRQFSVAAITGIVLALVAPVFLTIDSPIRSAFMNRAETFLGEKAGKTVRSTAYPASVALAVQKFPFGTGAGTFMSKNSRDETYSPYYRQSRLYRLWGGTKRDGRFLMDALWPKVIAQTGFIGTFAFGFLIMWPLFRAVSRIRQEEGAEIFASGAILITMAVTSLAAPVYTDDHLILPFAAAMAYAIKRRDWGVATASGAQRAARA